MRKVMTRHLFSQPLRCAEDDRGVYATCHCVYLHLLRIIISCASFLTYLNLITFLCCGMAYKRCGRNDPLLFLSSLYFGQQGFQEGDVRLQPIRQKLSTSWRVSITELLNHLLDWICQKKTPHHCILILQHIAIQSAYSQSANRLSASENLKCPVSETQEQEEIAEHKGALACKHWGKWALTLRLQIPVV